MSPDSERKENEPEKADLNTSVLLTLTTPTVSPDEPDGEAVPLAKPETSIFIESVWFGPILTNQGLCAVPWPVTGDGQHATGAGPLPPNGQHFPLQHWASFPQLSAVVVVVPPPGVAYVKLIYPRPSTPPGSA